MQKIVNIFNQTTDPNANLFLTHAGFSTNLADHHYGPTIRHEYLIHIILKGHGIVKTQQQIWQLSAGDGFLSTPQQVIAYQADHQNPWQYLFFGFQGSKAHLYLDKMGFSNQRLVFQTSQLNFFVDCVKQCLQHQSKNLVDELFMTGIIYQLLAGLARYQTDVITPDKAVILHPCTIKATDYLAQHFQEPITVKTMCQAIGFDRVYVSKLFKQDLQMTPHDYLNHLRIEYAVDLLSMTTMSVSDVAHVVGFSNVDVFIRSFKKLFAITPKQFQKRETTSHSIKDSLTKNLNFQLRL